MRTGSSLNRRSLRTWPRVCACKAEAADAYPECPRAPGEQDEGADQASDLDAEDNDTVPH